jgi:head-tail adaptor
MRAGRLRHRVEVQAHGGTLDARGDSSQKYVSVGTRWASIEALSGRELEIERRTDERVTHEIRMRYDRALRLTTRHRLSWVDPGTGVVTIFNVVDVRNEGQRDRETVAIAIADGAS